MSKTQYPTKYQITKLEQRVDEELDPIINLAELELKSVLTEQTEIAMTYLAKKIKADKVIDNLQKAVEQLEVAQRQAVTFFGKIKDNSLRQKLNYKFKDKDKDNYYRSSYDKGIMPEDCRDQLREFAEFIAQQKVENMKEGKKLKELKLYKKASKHKIWECGVPEQLQSQLEQILSGINIIWDKSKQLRLENKRYN
jgi:beta-glucosidase-like glycosyl hydrolase